MTTSTLGNIDTARSIYRHFERAVDGWTDRAPKGWNKVGDGAYRIAFLNRAENLVYKVGDMDANLIESANSRRLRKRSTRSLPFDLYVPATRTYPMRSNDGYRTNVIVQEYAAGAKPTHCRASNRYFGHNPPCTCKRDQCFADVLKWIGDWSGLEDMHAYNVLIDKADRFWLIDMGC